MLGFLVAVTVLAELADRAEVFDVAADRVARLGTWQRASAVPAGLPARHPDHRLSQPGYDGRPAHARWSSRWRCGSSYPPLPFAMTAVWLANTASLLLPVSNLTNLLAADKLGRSGLLVRRRRWRFRRLTAVVVVGGGARRAVSAELRGVTRLPLRRVASDRVLLVVGAVTCLGFGPAVIAGVPCVGSRDPRGRRTRPGVRLATARRPAPPAAAVATRDPDRGPVSRGRGRRPARPGPPAPRRDRQRRDLAGRQHFCCRVERLQQLPAYLAIERQTPRHDLLALLCGVNIGPLVLLWGSLATLLWRERCKARGVEVSAGQFARLGLIGMPLVLAASLGALALS